MISPAKVESAIYLKKNHVHLKLSDPPTDAASHPEAKGE